MTKPESTLPVPDAPLPPARRSRLRRFFLRHLPFSLAGAIVVLGAAFTAFYFFVSSATFEAIVLRRLVVMLEESTGGHVQIASFHWRPLRLDAGRDRSPARALQFARFLEPADSIARP
jgi:hypothetical protein